MPLEIKVLQYLIWKFLLVVWIPQLGMGMAAIIHGITPLWKVPILLSVLVKSIATLLRYAISIQSSPILLHKMAFLGFWVPVSVSNQLLPKQEGLNFLLKN